MHILEVLVVLVKIVVGFASGKGHKLRLLQIALVNALHTVESVDFLVEGDKGLIFVILASSVLLDKLSRFLDDGIGKLLREECRVLFVRAEEGLLEVFLKLEVLERLRFLLEGTHR